LRLLLLYPSKREGGVGFYHERILVTNISFEFVIKKKPLCSREMSFTHLRDKLLPPAEDSLRAALTRVELHHSTNLLSLLSRRHSHAIINPPDPVMFQPQHATCTRPRIGELGEILACQANDEHIGAPDPLSRLLVAFARCIIKPLEPVAGLPPRRAKSSGSSCCREYASCYVTSK